MAIANPGLAHFVVEYYNASLANSGNWSLISRNNNLLDKHNNSGAALNNLGNRLNSNTSYLVLNKLSAVNTTAAYTVRAINILRSYLDITRILAGGDSYLSSLPYLTLNEVVNDSNNQQLSSCLQSVANAFEQIPTSHLALQQAVFSSLSSTQIVNCIQQLLTTTYSTDVANAITADTVALTAAANKITADLAAGGKSFFAQAILNGWIDSAPFAASIISTNSDGVYQLRWNRTNQLITVDRLAELPTTAVTADVPAPVTINATTNGLEVSWQAVAEANFYRLSRSTTEANFTEIYAGRLLQFTDATVESNTVYNYRLAACIDNSTGSCSVQSEPSSATSLPAAPNAPTVVTLSTTQLTIGWTTIAGLTEFRLSRAPANSATFTEVYTGSDLTFEDSGLQAGTAYSYQLFSCRTNAQDTCSAPSNSAQGVTIPGAPVAPTVVAQSSSQIQVSWSTITNVSYYRLSRSASASSSGTQVYAGTDNSFTDSQLTANTVYYYTLQACLNNSANSCSTQSAANSVSTALDAPAAPTAVAQSNGDIETNWQAVNNATQYRLSRALSINSTYTEIYVGADTNYTDNQTAGGTTYYYTLATCLTIDESSCSAQSAASTATTVPAVPALPVVVAQSNGDIETSWQAVNGATYYRLSRSESTDTDTYTEIYAGANINYTDSQVTAGTTYYYTLQACLNSDASSCSAQSADSNATASLIVPAVPAAPVVTLQSTSTIDISWQTVSDATLYRLFRSVSANSGFTPIETTANTSFTDSQLTAGTTYYYTIAACLNSTLNTCSAQSVAGNTATLPAIPTAPVLATQSNSEIEASWQAVDGATQYRLSRALSLNSTFTEIYAGADTNYTDNQLTANTVYYYTLQACLDNNANSCSAQSTASNARTALAAPAAPAADIVQFVSDISVSWQTVSNATQYRLSRALSANSTYTQIYAGPNTIHVDSNTAAGITYYYTLKACLTTNESSCSLPSVASTVSTIPPSAPPPTVTAQSNGDIEASWQPVTGAAIYYLYRALSASGSLNRVYRGADTSYTDNSLTGGTTYYYSLLACLNISLNSCSEQSPRSNATTILVTPPVPAAPVLTAQSNGNIDASWQTVTGATQYRLYRSASASGTPSLIYTGADTSYPDSQPAAGTIYYYTLAACLNSNDNSCSAQSTASSATAIFGASAPVVTAQSNGDLLINWQAVAGATEYRLRRSLSETSGYGAVYTGANTSFTDSPPNRSTPYFYTIAACLNSNESSCSAQSAAVSGTTVPAVPIAPQVIALSGSRISISWTQDNGATHYRAYRALSATGNYTEVYTGGNFFHEDTELASETTYYYQVVACLDSNENSCSARSPQANATTLLPQPQGVTAVAISHNQITVSWAPVTNTVNYRLSRTSAPNGIGTYTLEYNGTNASFSDTQLTANTQYYYRVAACLDNTSFFCSESSTSVPATTLVAPQSQFITSPNIALQGGSSANPTGIWSDGDTIWVLDDTADSIFAYDFDTKARTPNQDFTTLDAGRLLDIWSDGTTMWVLDSNTAANDVITAYNMGNKARNTAKDFTNAILRNTSVPDTTNLSLGGMGSDGTTLWVSDEFDSYVYGYRLSDRTRDASQGFATTAENNSPRGIWSNDTTIWVADIRHIFAYDKQTKAHTPDKDIYILDSGVTLSSIWSNGSILWATNSGRQEIIARSLSPFDAPTFTTSTGAIVPSWQPIAGATQYRVYRSTDSDFIQLTTTVQTQYTDNSIEVRYIYSYIITACSSTNQNSCTISSALSTATFDQSNVFLSGDLRLQDGTAADNGRLEVFNNGQWGTVCDDVFGTNDARVACRQLGYPQGSVIRNTNTVNGTGPIFLDQLECGGSESRLVDCSHNGIGIHDCQHIEDVGVNCAPPTTTPTTPTTQIGEGALRIIPAGSASGRLEVFHDSSWGTICDDAFDNIDAEVACRQLGLPFGSAAADYTVPAGTGQIWLDNVDCDGNETQITDCSHNGLVVIIAHTMKMLALIANNQPLLLLK